ncbi:response regulator [Spongiimicrobium salis]|uniref:response regulator n=1 Tax=Spongiimicrobium salis TaxID=1667022 RepID=UPI00374CDD16
MSLKVCIIDDDLVSQFATQYRIEQSEIPCSISNYDSAEKFLEVITGNKNVLAMPDILLLDLIMTGMSGWELLEEVEKRLGTNFKTKVYVLSAFNNSKDRKLAKSHPKIQGYFDKPLSKDNVDKIFQSHTT